MQCARSGPHSAYNGALIVKLMLLRFGGSSTNAASAAPCLIYHTTIATVLFTALISYSSNSFYTVSRLCRSTKSNAGTILVYRKANATFMHLMAEKTNEAALETGKTLQD